MIRQANLHTHEHGAGGPIPQLPHELARFILVWFRARLGYGIVNPLNALAMAAALIFLPTAFWWLSMGVTGAPPPTNTGQIYLTGFAVATWLLTLLTWIRRLMGQRRGEEIDTHDAGYSFLTLHVPSLPVWFNEQAIFPGAFFMAGWVAFHSFSLDLGAFLMASGVSLLLLSNWEMRRRWAIRRAAVDDLVRARSFGAVLDEHERMARGAPEREPAGGRSDTGARGGQEESAHDRADLGGSPRPKQRRRPAEPPDMAGWSGHSDSVTPDYVGWFRRRRRGRGGLPALRE